MNEHKSRIDWERNWFPWTVFSLMPPIAVTVFALVDASEVTSRSLARIPNMLFWLSVAAAALIVIRPWSHRERLGPTRSRFAIYSLWGWVLGGLLAVSLPVYGWTASTEADSRLLAGQFWHEVAESIPLLDLPSTIGWQDPVPEYPIAVGAVFLAARIATLLVVSTIVVVEWKIFASRQKAES